MSSFNDIISHQPFIGTNMLLILIRINYRYAILIPLVCDSSPLDDNCVAFHRCPFELRWHFCHRPASFNSDLREAPQTDLHAVATFLGTKDGEEVSHSITEKNGSPISAIDSRLKHNT